MTECDCSEEYGPCEMHCVQLAQREGASLRTADELCLVYLDDALGIDPECLSPYGLDVKLRAETALRELSDACMSNWLDDHQLADELRDVCWQVESHLDAQTYWEDGYRIVKITGGPLLEV